MSHNITFISFLQLEVLVSPSVILGGAFAIIGILPVNQFVIIFIEAKSKPGLYGTKFVTNMVLNTKTLIK